MLIKRQKNNQLLNNFLYFHLPAILWMALIFCLSSISDLKSGVSEIWLELLLRKTAHLMVYAVLFFLFFRCFFFAQKLSKKKASLLSLLAVFCFAISDEVHQAFVPGRSSRVYDVLLDFIGALIGCWLLFFFGFNNRKGKKFNFSKKSINEG